MTLTKEQIISAYTEAGLEWEDIKYYVDENGWLSKSIFHYTDIKYHQIKTACQHTDYKCRPISLKV